MNSKLGKKPYYKRRNKMFLTGFLLFVLPFIFWDTCKPNANRPGMFLAMVLLGGAWMLVGFINFLLEVTR